MGQTRDLVREVEVQLRDVSSSCLGENSHVSVEEHYIRAVVPNTGDGSPMRSPDLHMGRQGRIR